MRVNLPSTLCERFLYILYNFFLYSFNFILVRISCAIATILVLRQNKKNVDHR